MIHEYYFIDEKGIFFTEKVYNDIDYKYCIEFKSPTVNQDFKLFCDRLRREGMAEKAAEIKSVLQI